MTFRKHQAERLQKKIAKLIRKQTGIEFVICDSQCTVFHDGAVRVDLHYIAAPPQVVEALPSEELH